MHPRAPRQPWDAATRTQGSRAARVRRARAGRPTRAQVEAHFAHGRRDQRLGRLVPGDDAPPRRDALPRPAAGAPARGRHRASTQRRGHAPADDAPAARRARADALLDLVVAQVRAAAGVEPGLPRAPAALRRAAARGRARRRARRARERLASARVDGATGTGRRARTRARRDTRPTSACGCSRRSIRSSGTGAASRCSGAGRTASRRTRRRRSASSATTRCRCSGATASIGWANASLRDGRLVVATGFASAPERERGVQACARRRARADGRVPRRSERARRHAARSSFCATATAAASARRAGASTPPTHEAGAEAADAVGDEADRARSDDLPGGEDDREAA